MCKHDVINIHHATLTARSSPNCPCLQWVFLHAKAKAACEPYCLSLVATSSSFSLCANMTSSINWKYVTYHCATRGRPSHSHR